MISEVNRIVVSLASIALSASKSHGGDHNPRIVRMYLRSTPYL
jgi:hypothetical protein